MNQQTARLNSKATWKQDATSTNEETIDTLNNLIGICKNGENGYRTAAEVIEHGTYTTLFNKYTTQRAEFARQLEQEIVRLGGQPDANGIALAPLHRFWIEIKAAATNGGAEADFG